MAFPPPLIVPLPIAWHPSGVELTLFGAWGWSRNDRPAKHPTCARYLSQSRNDRSENYRLHDRHLIQPRCSIRSRRNARLLIQRQEPQATRKSMQQECCVSAEGAFKSTSRTKAYALSVQNSNAAKVAKRLAMAGHTTACGKNHHGQLQAIFHDGSVALESMPTAPKKPRKCGSRLALIAWPSRGGSNCKVISSRLSFYDIGPHRVLYSYFFVAFSRSSASRISV